MVNTQPIQTHELDHSTPIFDQLIRDWGHAPGSLTPIQEEEMLAYAAEMAAHPNPIVKGFEPAELSLTAGEPHEQPVKLDIPAPVAPVIVVGTLADKAAQDAADAIVAEAEAQEPPQEPEEEPAEPEAQEADPEAATALLERVVPAQREDADTAVLPVVEEAPQ